MNTQDVTAALDKAVRIAEMHLDRGYDPKDVARQLMKDMKAMSNTLRYGE